MKMSDAASHLKEENERIKELFNFNGDEAQLKHLNEDFANLLNDSEIGAYYYFSLLDYYSNHRENKQVSKELVDCSCSCFPEVVDDIQEYIKKSTNILKIIIFPEEFPMKGTKEQNEMFLLLKKDDIDGFISFLSNNPTIDITKEQELEKMDITNVSLLILILFHSLMFVVSLVH